MVELLGVFEEVVVDDGWARESRTDTGPTAHESTKKAPFYRLQDDLHIPAWWHDTTRYHQAAQSEHQLHSQSSELV